MKFGALHSIRLRPSPPLKTKMLAYLLLLSSIPVALMGIVSAFHTSRIIREQAEQSNVLLLKQTEKEMNSFFKKIDDLMLQYTHASSTSTLMLKRFVDADLSTENWKTVMDLSEILVKLQSGMEHVLEINFYSVPYGKVFSPRGKLYTDGEFGDQLAINEVRKLTYSNRWLDLRMSVPNNELLNRPVLTIIKPILQNNQVEAALIVYLDATAISSYKLVTPDPYEGSALFVADENGSIILHSDTSRIGGHLDEPASQRLQQVKNTDWISQGKLSMNEVSFHTVMMHSKTRNWYYFAVVPEKAFTSKVNSQRNIMLAVSTGLVLAGLITGYCASRNLYRPLQRLTSKLKPTASGAALGGSGGEGGDEVEWLDRYLESLSLENKQLFREVSIYLDHAKQFMLHQLLVGGTPHQNILYQDQEAPEEEPAFIPLLLVDLNRARMAESYSRQDCSLYYYAVDNIAMELLGEKGKPQVIMIQPGLFVTIVPMETPLSPEELRGLGRGLQEAILRYLKLNSFIAVSYSDTGSDGLHIAYEEASTLLRYRFLVGDNRVMLAHDVEASVSMQADMLFHNESEITEALRMRKWSEAEEIFLNFINTLQESFSISEDLLRSYFPQLLSAIAGSVRVAPQDPFDPNMVQQLLVHLAKCHTLEEIRCFFRDNVFAALRREFKETTATSHRIRLVEETREYIHNHYDTDLSLQQCAERAGINPFDLSRMFKQITGINFIDYLIELRMEKAKELLADPGLRIQDIADKLRYTSLQGFMRAFKKSTGLTPGQYRTRLKG